MPDNEKKVVFETEWFNIEQEYFPELSIKPFYRLNCDDNVIVLAQTVEGRLVLVRQFRPAILQMSMELPSGAVDPGETPAAAAARELYEETGYVCETMTLLSKGKILLNRLNAEEYLFLAQGCVQEAGFFPKESIETVLLSPADLKALAVEGKFEQFSTLALLLLADWKAGTNFVRSL